MILCALGRAGRRSIFGSSIWAGAAVACAGAGGPASFNPGHIYAVRLRGEVCDNSTQVWILDIDPETGTFTTFADYEDGLCNISSVAFAPDRRRLRVANIVPNNILEFDADGHGSVVYTSADRLGGPWGQSGLAWDQSGAFYVANEYSVELLRFRPDGSPATIVADYADGLRGGGGIIVDTDQTVYLAEQELKRISPRGDLTILDMFGSQSTAMSIAMNANIDLFVAIVNVNRGELYRYDGADPATRRLLASGLELGSQYCSIALSPNEREVYFARGSYIWAIDVDTGDQRVVFNIAGGLGRGIAVYTPPKPGDMNCDNWVNNFDIDPFVLALSDEASYQATFGWCDRTRADMNADGAINSFDIDGFVEAVVGGRAD